MALELIHCIATVALLAFGPGWLIAARLPLAHCDRMLASLVLSLLAGWLWNWTIFISGFPWSATTALPVVAAVGLLWRRRELVALLADPTCQALLVSQALVAGWCLGWSGLVQTYSGGGWTSDWFEHWERALFFLRREPLDHLFLGVYPLTARPPLANILMVGWLELTEADFAHYQLFSTLLASLVFLPAALLAAQLGGRSAPKDSQPISILAVLCMLNPLFVQNTTFPWTKLPAAMFVLAALHFYLRAGVTRTAKIMAALFGLALAAGLLTHYSAAPYAIALGIAWWRRRPPVVAGPDFARATLVAAIAGALVLATWLGWAIPTYGVSGSLMTNTAITTVANNPTSQAWRIAFNLRDTVVPHFLRSPESRLIEQSSPWGYVRDWFFQSYQLNLIFAFGSLTWLVLLRELWQRHRRADHETRRFWWSFGAIVFTLGVATHGARDEWGLTHICLQALVLMGLAVVAVGWPQLHNRWRRLVYCGVAFDFATGIALHFAIQSQALDHWLAPGRTAAEIARGYNQGALMNLGGMIENRLLPAAGAIDPTLALALALAAIILALCRARSFKHRGT